MRTKRKKQIKCKKPVSTQKKPKISTPSKEKTIMCWSYALFDKPGPFGYRDSEKHAVQNIFDKKKNLETMKDGLWTQGSHAVAVGRLCKEAQNRLSYLKLDDASSLFSFKITKKARIWCQKVSGEPMRVLWWDPEHKVCPSKKKHT